MEDEVQHGEPLSSAACIRADALFRVDAALRRAQCMSLASACFAPAHQGPPATRPSCSLSRPGEQHGFSLFTVALQDAFRVAPYLFSSPPQAALGCS